MIRKGLPAHVKEADYICHHTETLELAALRESAKTTGNWTPYDRCYGSILASRTDEDDIILMASSDLSPFAHCTILARLLLRRDLWEKNVLARGEKVEKYLNNYLAEQQEEHIVADSLEELYELVQHYCNRH